METSHTEEAPDPQAGQRQDEVRTDAVPMRLQVTDHLPRTAHRQFWERTDSTDSYIDGTRLVSSD